MSADRPAAGKRGPATLTAAALLMTASVFLSRVLGYVRDAIVAALHGAGTETDIYYASFTLADLMSYMLAGGALSITFLPMFSRALHERGEEAAERLFGLVATTMAVVLVVVIAVMWVITPWVIPRLFPGFSEAALAETIHLTRINLPGQIFFYVGGLCSATVMARTHFRAAALAPLVYNAVIIAVGLAFQGAGIEGFAWGAVIGAVLGPFAVNVWAARMTGLRWRPSISFRDKDFGHFVRMSLPVMAGFSLVSVDEWIGRWVASGLGEGSISWLQNARRLMLVPVSVLGQAAGQATLPFLARLRAEGRLEEAGKLLQSAISTVGFLTLVASAALVALAGPGVAVFYERGAFTPEDTAATAAALVPMALGTLFWSVQALTARGFYALEDTLTPMRLATVVTVLSVPVYLWLGRTAGVSGIGAATTLGMAATALITLLALRRRFPLDLQQLTVSLGRSAGLAAVAGGLAYAVACAFGSAWLAAGFGGATLLATVLIGARVLRIPEALPLLRRLRLA